MGVFSKNQGGKKTLKRNTYPVSRQINTTFNFGQLIPFSVREINPGESVKIRPSVGLRFMPTYFPVQNKMKCYINYFYVRSRNLYKDFKQFYEDNSPSTPHPYLGFPSALASSRAKMFSVGGLADHMGVSVTRHVSAGETFASNLRSSVDQNTFTSPYFMGFFAWRFLNSGNSPVVPLGADPVYSSSYLPIVYSTSSSVYRTLSSADYPSGSSLPSGAAPFWSFGLNPSQSSLYFGNTNFIDGLVRIPIQLTSSGVLSSMANRNIVCGLACSWSSSGSESRDNFAILTIGNSFAFGSDYLEFPSLSESSALSLLGLSTAPSDFAMGIYITLPPSSSDDTVLTSGLPRINSLGSNAFIPSFSYGESHVTSVGQSLSSFNPFSEELDAESFVPLNSMPFRAYEQIYNAFYRDERNNPLMKDGKPVYDEFLLNTDGGRDNSDYQIHYRNWEQDAYTTALPSPQQGIAPLVGISSTGIATFQDLESGKQYTVKSITDDTGDNVVNAEFTEDSLSDMNADWKPSVARALINYATSGISINDFRNVNALQRFKELNLRRGRKYKDLMEARFGVNISYAEMNMPEFIGGASFDVQPVQVNQTTNQGEKDPLGSYAGQLFASGGSKHSITKFCDEHGYIIGIISVVPTPVYETVTPKFFFKHHLLDFWQPEFNHIGLQPIPMKELDVFGQFAKSPDNMDEEFGYQRPWYDYISALDSVHGQFRTSLSSFVMYRSWSEPPSLSPDFLLVDPSSGIDDVFSVRTDSEGNSIDKILGQIYEDYTIKSPVSKFGIAKLE